VQRYGLFLYPPNFLAFFFHRKEFSPFLPLLFKQIFRILPTPNENESAFVLPFHRFDRKGQNINS
jgi:hypothetical protein